MPAEAPSTCTECGNGDIQPISDQSDEFVCSDCGLVFRTPPNNTASADSNIDVTVVIKDSEFVIEDVTSVTAQGRYTVINREDKHSNDQTHIFETLSVTRNASKSNKEFTASTSAGSDGDTEYQKSDKREDVPDLCASCGGDNIVYDDPIGDFCSDCGLVLEDSTIAESSDNISMEVTVSSSDGEFILEDIESVEVNNKHVKVSREDNVNNIEKANSNLSLRDSKYIYESLAITNNPQQPQNADEWRMWYPCPECQSTALEQIVEKHLDISATKNGSYGGDTGGMEEYNYIECRDCGEVLLDEIGKS